jgi:hypothetical protein
VQVLSEINGAHPALAKFVDNSIMGNRLADHRGLEERWNVSGQRVLQCSHCALKGS